MISSIRRIQWRGLQFSTTRIMSLTTNSFFRQNISDNFTFILNWNSIRHIWLWSWKRKNLLNPKKLKQWEKFEKLLTWSALREFELFSVSILSSVILKKTKCNQKQKKTKISVFYKKEEIKKYLECKFSTL